ncbi:hypothetical protein A4R26_01075 [Niastella populi]|uniref:Uncharacterized protein n=1 Tax=Niastella populi TaxID=550983 RepID=A0A1V9GCM4_9BACT|nr:hypothetical protein A4R26_01075 [Niastella populi]
MQEGLTLNAKGLTLQPYKAVLAAVSILGELSDIKSVKCDLLLVFCVRIKIIIIGSHANILR